MQLYDPIAFLDRTYRHYRILGTAPCHAERRRKMKGKPKGKTGIKGREMQAMLTLFWRQGVLRKTRIKFWIYLAQMFIHNRGGIPSYLGVCAQIEHFLEYREIVKNNIETQLAAFLVEEKRLREQQKQAQEVGEKAIA
jgi:hypothetical protein